MGLARDELLEEDLAALAANDPDNILDELDRMDSEESLRDYVKLGWHVLEPGRRYVPNWHIDCICDHLMAVHLGQITRINFNIPPGGMKSLLTDAFFPSWEWGPKDRADLRYLSFSYSLDLTIRDNRRTRSLIMSPWYHQKWGHRFKLVGDQNAKTRFDNDRMGYKIATSIGGLGTGERGDRVVIDDPHNVKEGESEADRREKLLWFTEVIPTRLCDPIWSAIILIMQRVHQRDIVGEMLERDLGYVNVILPMEFEPDRKCFVEVTGWEDPRTEENELLWPERFPREVVERDKRAMGEYATAGQLQQRPAPRGGGMFKRTWWRFYHTDTSSKDRPIDCDWETPSIPMPKDFDMVVISIDATFKMTVTGSRVGALVIARLGPKRFVLDNRTGPMDFNGTLATIRSLRQKYPRCSRVLVEDKANGPAIVNVLSQEISGVIAVNPEGGKETRANAMQPAVESGHWYLPEGAAWLDSFITEFALFPAGAKDDQVDAASQGAIYMTQSSDVVRLLSLSKV